MKTAIIYRSHVYGTLHHSQALCYRGNVVSWWENGYLVLAKAPCCGHETIQTMIERARRHGFTHVRFAGDWKRFTTPTKIKIPAGPYQFSPRPIAKILNGD